MPKELYLITDMPRESPFQHHIVTVRKAKKEHTCSQCRELIAKGQEYCEVVFGGSGLASLKFPDRVHRNCINNFLMREDHV